MSASDRRVERKQTQSARRQEHTSRRGYALTRRSFVGGLVLLSGCNGLNIGRSDAGGNSGGTSSGNGSPSGSASTGTYLTIVESSFVPGQTFNDDRPDERGRLQLRVRNDAGMRMRSVDLMPSFYNIDGQPIHVGTQTVWNLDPEEIWRVAIPYPGRGTEVNAFQVAGTFTVGSAVTGTAGAADDGASDASASPLELISGSDALSIDACNATVSGQIRNTGSDLVRYAGALIKLYADGELLGTTVSHRTGLAAGTEWHFNASTAIDDLVVTPTDHTVEVSGPWWPRGY